jgi:signal transduction histidine kinase
MNETGPSVPAAFPSNSPRQFNPRTALYAGFGALLALMAVMSVDALRSLGVIQTNEAQIRRDYLNRERTLVQVRYGLNESDKIVRDYFYLKVNPAEEVALRTELAAVRDQTNSELRARIKSLPPESRRPLLQLAAELEDYWSTLDPVFKLDSKQKQESASLFFRSDVSSQHAAVLAITRDISMVNESDLREGEARIAAVFEQFRRRWLIISTTAFSLGLFLAGATILHIFRLEKNVEDRYHESLEAQRELRDLSKRLVDAQEQERRTISRELHDEVGQSLGALLMEVQNLAVRPGEDGWVRQGLKNVQTLAENCVNEVRNIALLLRPSMLDDLGLVAALEWQAREVSKRTGMLVDFSEENVSDSLSEEAKTCIYRIVQEALHNCSRHSHARTVQITIRQETERLSLAIRDDGTGFDPRHARGLGIVGINERVTHLGGVFHVDSRPGHGTCLRVDLPLSAAHIRQDHVTQ